MPALLSLAAVAFEQEAVHLHHPIDPLGVDRRTVFPGTSPPDQGVDAAVAVGGLTGNGLLDLG